MKSVRAYIGCSFYGLRLWHMPIQVERATRSLTLYDSMFSTLSCEKHIIIIRKLPIVASSLTWIKKLPDFKPSRISVDKRLIIYYKLYSMAIRYDLYEPTLWLYKLYIYAKINLFA